MAGMEMSHCHEFEVYSPARSLLEIARRVLCVLRVAAVYEGKMISALNKNAVRAPGVQKMYALTRRRCRNVLVPRGCGRVFGRPDNLRSRGLNLSFCVNFLTISARSFIAIFFSPFGKLFCLSQVREKPLQKKGTFVLHEAALNLGRVIIRKVEQIVYRPA